MPRRRDERRSALSLSRGAVLSPVSARPVPGVTVIATLRLVDTSCRLVDDGERHRIAAGETAGRRVGPARRSTSRAWERRACSAEGVPVGVDGTRGDGDLTSRHACSRRGPCRPEADARAGSRRRSGTRSTARRSRPRRTSSSPDCPRHRPSPCRTAARRLAAGRPATGCRSPGIGDLDRDRITVRVRARCPGIEPRQPGRKLVERRVRGAHRRGGGSSRGHGEQEQDGGDCGERDPRHGPTLDRAARIVWRRERPTNGAPTGRAEPFAG